MEARTLKNNDIIKWNNKHFIVQNVQFIRKYGEYVVVCKDAMGCYHTPKESDLINAKLVKMKKP